MHTPCLEALSCYQQQRLHSLFVLLHQGRAWFHRLVLGGMLIDGVWVVEKKMQFYSPICTIFSDFLLLLPQNVFEQSKWISNPPGISLDVPLIHHSD